MPFQVGGVAVHDDGQHTGSAKRDTASGVAGLDASGNLIIPGSTLSITRSAGNNMLIYDRTSGESACYFTRVGVNDFDLFMYESGAWEQAQTASMKDVASGIAGLNAGAKVPDANLESPVGTHATDTSTHGATAIAGMNSGSYTGDGAANRAIAHGLGRIPLMVIVTEDAVVSNLMTTGNPTKLIRLANESVGTVTTMDATNFYVMSGFGNTNLSAEKWIAIG